MIKYKAAERIDMVPESVVCDVCGKEYTDNFEMQEFQYIYHDTGYASIFEDNNTIQVDICQHCFKEKLGQYLRIKSIDDF